MTMMVKVGYLNAEGDIAETHWFHSAFQVIALMVDGNELEQVRPTPGIHLSVPASVLSSKREAAVAWAKHDLREQLAGLPPSLNPFIGGGMHKSESGIIVPK
jgi:hypothetical protein